MTYQSSSRKSHPREFRAVFLLTLLAIAATFFSLPALAQQTGDIAGTVTKADGSPAAGVTIEATSPVLPGVRTTTTSANGDYRLPLLPPGDYTVTYTLEDQSTRVLKTSVLLQKRSTLDLSLAEASAVEEVLVLGTNNLTDASGASISAGISNEVFDALPVGQEYRDLIKLIPGVQYTEDQVRGPSAGGSGQDNVYQFDGVDVSLPFFGTLSAEPSSHDVEQFSIVRGGAKAIGFNRSGGVTVNSSSKSGSDEFHGSISYQVQTGGMTGDRKIVSASEFEEDKDWAVANFSGPLVKDKLYFYTSYYAPTVTRVNRANAYGEVGDYDSDRDEYFGKLTWAVTDDFLLDLSHRTSDRTVVNSSVGGFTADSASEGSKASQDISILEGSWVINDNSSAYFKYTDFENLTSSGPDTLFSFPISIGGTLDVNNLDMQGLFNVPRPIAGQDAYNAFIQPLIEKYGYLENGVRTGGGVVGGASQINDQNFFRESLEFGYDITIEGDKATHDLHFGYKKSLDEEDLARFSNGWGSITVGGGRLNTPISGVPYFYQARFEQQSLQTNNGTLAPVIHSETESQSFEINDTISWDEWTLSIGVMFSNDQLYGQGLKAKSGTISGFEESPTSKYLMKEIDFDEQIQPRIGINWDYSDRQTFYANYARYYPAATSLARAASWARNLRSTRNAYFDASGNFIESQAVASSSGKFFQEGIDPRHTDEYLVGTSYEFSDNLVGRAHVRYRASRDFWEDTNNNARVDFSPPAGIPQTLYVPNLNEVRAEIGGSSFVIAQLDGSYTDYYEASFEAEYTSESWYVLGSYVWSDYTGNFDQDNTSTGNDANLFIGSSNLADDVGRQLWDLKDGTLRGNRKHQLKIYGSYLLDWNASVGAYFIYQSGQPWETWDVEFYREQLTSVGSGSTSSTNRYSERAGSRTSPSHHQLDLNYTQNFYFGSERGVTVQLRADLYNVFDNQTGYDYNPVFNSSSYGLPRNAYNPRRLQLTAKVIF